MHFITISYSNRMTLCLTGLQMVKELCLHVYAVSERETNGLIYILVPMKVMINSNLKRSVS